MRKHTIRVRSFAERLPDGQWQAFCVTFNLAVQADSLPEARRKLDKMVQDYIHDATKGEDREHCEMLLRRRAPLYFWMKYLLTLFLVRVYKKRRQRKPFVQKFPYTVPQPC